MAFKDDIMAAGSVGAYLCSRRTEQKISLMDLAKETDATRWNSVYQQFRNYEKGLLPKRSQQSRELFGIYTSALGLTGEQKDELYNIKVEHSKANELAPQAGEADPLHVERVSRYRKAVVARNQAPQDSVNCRPARYLNAVIKEQEQMPLGFGMVLRKEWILELLMPSRPQEMSLSLDEVVWLSETVAGAYKGLSAQLSRGLDVTSSLPTEQRKMSILFIGISNEDDPHHAALSNNHILSDMDVVVQVLDVKLHMYGTQGFATADLTRSSLHQAKGIYEQTRIRGLETWKATLQEIHTAQNQL